MENIVFDELFNIISAIMPQGVFTYRKSSKILAEEINYNIVEVVGNGTDVDYGNYYEYRIVNETGSTSTDDGFDLNWKTAIINGYNETTIIDSRTDAGEGEIIKVINVSDTIISYDTPTTAQIGFTSSAYVDYMTMQVPAGYMGRRYSNMSEGVVIGILIKTKNDDLKTSINDITSALMNSLQSYMGNFPINVDGNIKYAKIAGNIVKEDGGMDADNIQSRSIYLPLVYMVNYKT